MERRHMMLTDKMMEDAEMAALRKKIMESTEHELRFFNMAVIKERWTGAGVNAEIPDCIDSSRKRPHRRGRRTCRQQGISLERCIWNGGGDFPDCPEHDGGAGCI